MYIQFFKIYTWCNGKQTDKEAPRKWKFKYDPDKLPFVDWLRTLKKMLLVVWKEGVNFPYIYTKHYYTTHA